MYKLHFSIYFKTDKPALELTRRRQACGYITWRGPEKVMNKLAAVMATRGILHHAGCLRGSKGVRHHYIEEKPFQMPIPPEDYYSSLK